MTLQFLLSYEMAPLSVANVGGRFGLEDELD